MWDIPLGSACVSHFPCLGCMIGPWQVFDRVRGGRLRERVGHVQVRHDALPGHHRLGTTLGPLSQRPGDRREEGAGKAIWLHRAA